jgi:hypothetical protein
LAVVAAVFLAVLAGDLAFAAAPVWRSSAQTTQQPATGCSYLCSQAEGDVAGGAACVVAEAAAVAVAAFTACWQADDSFARLPLRHCSAWEPPRDTLLQ